MKGRARPDLWEVPEDEPLDPTPLGAVGDSVDELELGAPDELEVVEVVEELAL